MVMAAIFTFNSPLSKFVILWITPTSSKPTIFKPVRNEISLFFAHFVFTTRWAWLANNRVAFGQFVRCIFNPSPVVTNPKTSSPGMGLQQLANVYKILSLLSPKIMSSVSFLESGFTSIDSSFSSTTFNTLGAIILSP